MDSFYDSRGIIHQITCIETLEQNVITERKHQHIHNVARALLYQANLDKQFWCYAIKHVKLCDISNKDFLLPLLH